MPKLNPALEPSFTVSFVSDENQHMSGSAKTPNFIFCPRSPVSETTDSVTVRMIDLSPAPFPFILIDLNYYFKLFPELTHMVLCVKITNIN